MDSTGIERRGMIDYPIWTGADLTRRSGSLLNRPICRGTSWRMRCAGVHNCSACGRHGDRTRRCKFGNGPRDAIRGYGSRTLGEVKFQHTAQTVHEPGSGSSGDLTGDRCVLHKPGGGSGFWCGRLCQFRSVHQRKSYIPAQWGMRLCRSGMPLVVPLTLRLAWVHGVSCTSPVRVLWF